MARHRIGRGGGEMIELIVGLIGCFLLYWLGQFLYPESEHRSIIPEPYKLLINYGEAVGQIYGDESE